ncbi:hypothetical protein L1987_47437 [Smallanthus sonchifolius]|uniref:Uncharacterized protein n=1 Tax=Smallanthus sonchifolius TaxID=185202 RepID=A0ACB9G335_9ASTR|nr:hypothetical protein L1987_47437 [Smallanthus sonchifolius]
MILYLITYSKEDEAVRIIQSIHGFVLEGRPLRACFGTAKYCHAWMRSMAEGIYSALEKLGIHWISVGSYLELEGVDSFKKSFDGLLDSLQEKANSMKLLGL